MTEYFLITTIFDGKIDIDRKTPFTEQIEENNSFMNIERNWDKSIIPQMNDFIEKNGKKLNDITLIPHGPFRDAGFTLNDKTLKIFEQYKIMPFKIYPFEIEQKGGKIHLNYFHLISSFCNGTDIFKYIDFKKSILLKSINWGEQLIPLSVNSYEEYLNFQNNRQRREAVKVEAITFIKDIFDFDMFRNPFNNNIYISRIFKERLEFEKISGVEISPIDTFIINIL